MPDNLDELDDDLGGGTDPNEDAEFDGAPTTPIGDDDDTPTQEADGSLVYQSGYRIEPQGDGTFLHLDDDGNEVGYFDAENNPVQEEVQQRPAPTQTAPAAQTQQPTQQPEVFTEDDAYASGRRFRATLTAENPLMDDAEVNMRVHQHVNNNLAWINTHANTQYDQSRAQLAQELPTLNKYYGGAVRDAKDNLPVALKQTPRQAHFVAASHFMNEAYDTKDAQGNRMIEVFAEQLAAVRAGRKPRMTTTQTGPTRQPTPKNQRAVTIGGSIRRVDAPRSQRDTQRRSDKDLADLTGMDDAEDVARVASARPKITRR